MKRLKIDPLDLLNFPRKQEQEITEWVSDILAAKGVDAGKVVGHEMDAEGNIIVNIEI